LVINIGNVNFTKQKNFNNQKSPHWKKKIAARVPKTRPKTPLKSAEKRYDIGKKNRYRGIGIEKKIPVYRDISAKKYRYPIYRIR